MPTYDYICQANNVRVEVMHRMNERIRTWGELCLHLGVDPGDTPPDTPVEKAITAPRLNFPKTNAELKNLGFSKLVRRDKGVYENVTAQEGESRYVKPDDPATMPNFRKTISD